MAVMSLAGTGSYRIPRHCVPHRTHILSGIVHDLSRDPVLHDGLALLGLNAELLSERLDSLPDLLKLDQVEVFLKSHAGLVILVATLLGWNRRWFRLAHWLWLDALALKSLGLTVFHEGEDRVLSLLYRPLASFLQGIGLDPREWIAKVCVLAHHLRLWHTSAGSSTPPGTPLPDYEHLD